MDNKPKDGGCNCGKQIRITDKKGTITKNSDKIRKKIYGK